MNNFISIVVPIYNSAKYVEKLINSLILQEYINFEVIFIDDCSTDNSKEIVEILLKTSNITYKYSILKKNSGPGIARNAALKLMEGDYVLFIDSDDWIAKDTLYLLNETVNDINPDLIMFDYYRAWENGNVKKYRELHIPFGEVDKDLYASLTNDGVTRKLFKTSIIKKNNIKFPGWFNGEDIAFTIDYLSYANKLFYLEDALYYYFQRDESTSNNNIRDDEFYIKLHELYVMKFSNNKSKANRIVQDLFYNQTILYLKTCASKEKIKGYIKELQIMYKDDFNKVDLSQFGLMKRIFIYAVRYNLYLFIKVMWCIKNI